MRPHHAAIHLSKIIKVAKVASELKNEMEEENKNPARGSWEKKKGK